MCTTINFYRHLLIPKRNFWSKHNCNRVKVHELCSQSTIFRLHKRRSWQDKIRLARTYHIERMTSYGDHGLLFLALPRPLLRRNGQFGASRAVISGHVEQPGRLKKNETDMWTNNKSQLFCFHNLPVKAGRPVLYPDACSSFVCGYTRYNAWSSSYYLTFILNFCLSLHHSAGLYL